MLGGAGSGSQGDARAWGTLIIRMGVEEGARLKAGLYRMCKVPGQLAWAPAKGPSSISLLLPRWSPPDPSSSEGSRALLSPVP